MRGVTGERGDMDLESWRAVPGFPGYQVSNIGRLQGPSGPLKTRLHRANSAIYRSVTVGSGPDRRQVGVHRLVALAWSPGSGPVVRHLDGDSLNNTAGNLAWGTYRDNELDKVRHGRAGRGGANAGKTHCPQGHPYSEENTRRRRRGDKTHRECRTCIRQARPVRPQKPRALPTTCRRGHMYTPENTYTRPSGVRECWTCKRAAKAAYRAQKR